ncbi:efflux RND transporter periplasmic adaptor subunit [Psychrosphaera sp. B3R10]|uniref:efflux RND transporter periplasmic adaptor subunit n=1 Tax=unclassified Psychrosphaera TaxID=2641570 RepID=UPI001C098193|nr:MULTISPECIES: efflux RND transporter periplasmic adaptor subunit [unclassified Psychrosphaera]MBU2882760.1 efflux RND transporter periplasmic adaptor subunit [Psychrosphaera sp. I2R16]MBU2989222.1 efflux RND transporter periplasmic adaptor subunit [Psychrosphaera sp. B3R10]
MIKDTSAQDVAIESKPNIKKIAIIILIALIVITFTAKTLMNKSAVSHSFDRASMQIARVEMGELVRDIVSNGRIVAANAPQVYSPEQGFVSLKVKAGDTVNLGQIVATVDSPELANLLKQETSEIERLEGELARKELDARSQTLQLTKLLDIAQVDLEAAERESRRAHASMKSNLISEIDFEMAVDDLARAELTYKHAKEEVSVAKERLAFELASAKSTVSRQALVLEELKRKINDLNILATVKGVVGNLLVQQRALVKKNDALMTLVDLSAYEVELNVAESYANDLGIGMQAEINIAGTTFLGKLSAISPEVKNRQVTARVRFDQQQLTGIRQNQQVSARVLLESKTNVMKVRRGSFMQSGGFYAFKVEGDIAKKVEIQLGAKSMREVEILSGLNPSDQIIISNYDEYSKTDSFLLN